MLRRLPSLTGLQAFEAVARHQSVSRAAAELSLTQTAVSHRIGRLEAELGLSLFRRRGRGVVLTEDAQAYLPDVKAAFEALYDSTARLRRDDAQGSLTVSTLTSFAAKWLVPRLPGFHAAHPEIDVRILTASEPVDFDRESIDLAIRYGDGNWPGLTADHLLDEYLFPVCSPRLCDGPRPLRRPADLTAHTLVAITTYKGNWPRWLAVAGVPDLKPEGTLAFDLGFAAIEAVIDGAGVGMGRTALVKHDLARGRLVRPFGPEVRRRAYYLVAPRSTAGRPKIKLFRDWLLQSAASEPDR